MAEDSEYQRQERGSAADYERYLRGMDASMQQKVALTAAHLLGEGWLADMGMGSGTGTDALAGLYPEIRVTGVDINPEMVRLASDRYKRQNLDFRAGDISELCFEQESLDVVFNSSVLHHVTTFNDYEIEKARHALENQVRQLKTHGNLIVRDFLRPADQLVRLDLPSETAVLFRRFAQEFRFLKASSERGFEFQDLGVADDGWQSFEVNSQFAIEFILRKDYQADWDTEILEEYTYYTQREFEENFRALGLRLLASTPIRNPWIVNNRFRGKFRLMDSRGAMMPDPATNYLVVGEKVDTHEGVEYSLAEKTPAKGFLHLAFYENKESGSTRDLVRRPNSTLDVIPFFRQNGEVYVLCRRSYPRPILGLCDRRLDEALSPTYVTEPIVLIQQDKPLAQTVEEDLERRVGLSPDKLIRFLKGSVTYPSPGGLQEQVQSVFVEIEPTRSSSADERVRAISARQLLRAAQVGGLPDARLELHCFELLRLLGEKPGSWIGESIEIEESKESFDTATSVLSGKPRRCFRKSEQSSDFLALERAVFTERSSTGVSVREQALEYVRPKKLSLNTVAVAPLRRQDGKVFLGLCDEDFPAAQCFSGHSNLIVVPAWRCPQSVSNQLELEDFCRGSLAQDYGLMIEEVFTLGGAYFPSPGATPEIVYPLACEVKLAKSDAKFPLLWVELQELGQHFEDFRDGHLKILLSRLLRVFGET